MIPPKGFVAERYPLRHHFVYSAGLSASLGTMNSTMFTLVKNYGSGNNPNTIIVNPHHGLFETETGAICSPMSIIDKLKLTLRFNLTENAQMGVESANGAWTGDSLHAIKFSWTPIFLSFREKLDSSDQKSTDTGLEILKLTAATSQKDITPTWSTVKLPVIGSSDLAHPASTANVTETSGMMNLTTDTTMESVAWDQDQFIKALKYYTNKGAIKSMVGRTRHVTLSQLRPTASFHINKFVPKPIRRIVDYTWFGILIHVPIDSEADQYYYSHDPTDSVAHIGCKAFVDYHEWHADHIQEMSA